MSYKIVYKVNGVQKERLVGGGKEFAKIIAKKLLESGAEKALIEPLKR